MNIPRFARDLQLYSCFAIEIFVENNFGVLTSNQILNETDWYSQLYRSLHDFEFHNCNFYLKLNSLPYCTHSTFTLLPRHKYFSVGKTSNN